MAFWKEVAHRLGHLGRRRRFERELSDEMEFHIQTRADELEQEGLPRAEALEAARREFGSTLRAREETRSAWQFRRFEDLCADLRYAARAFRRNPSFAATAIGCLALAIGANTTMFSIAVEVLFSEPSCRDPQSLAQLRVGGSSFCPLPQCRFLRDARIFDGLAGMNIGMVVNWRDADGSYRVAGTHVTSNFFEVAGVPVAIGRRIASSDSHAVVLTHGFWMRRLGGDPNVLGRKLVLDGEPYTVAGILPRDHRNLAGFGFTPDLYLAKNTTEYARTMDFILYARLPQGIGRQAARARLEAACRELDRIYPDANHKWAGDLGVFGVGGMDRLRAEGGLAEGALMPVAAFFAMLVAVTGLVLLIACANVSSLLLARAFSRSRELAIRASLGGSRGRIVRQLLAESLLLALCGTGAGLAINLFLTRLLSGARLPIPSFPIEFLIEPDTRLLAYSVGIAFVVTLAAGLIPAIRSTREGIGGVLKEREPRVGNRRWTLRNALVVAQLAVSIVLLSGGLLLLRNLSRATSADPGFDTAHTIWATFRPVPESCTPERFKALVNRAVERLRALPGVESASAARAIPLGMPLKGGGEFRPDTSDRAIHAQYHYNFVGPEYFRTMQIPILSGRAFLDSDRGAPAVVILNENLARLLFGSANPVGHTIRLPDKRDVRVAGVARNSKYFILGEQNPLAIYEPWTQNPAGMRFAHFLVRAGRTPESLVRAVNRTLADLDPMAAVETRTMRDAVQFTLLPSRVGAGVLGAMAVLGLALASIGLYGVLLYAVSRRMREIGIRVALGATPASILRMVAGESACLLGAGLAVGLGLAVFAVRPLSMFLVPGVRPADPLNFVAVAGALALVAALATISPAARALRVDPAVSLRHE